MAKGDHERLFQTETVLLRKPAAFICKMQMPELIRLYNIKGDFMNTKEQLKQLVHQYQNDKKTRRVALSEEETRGWINKFLEVFEWDVLNTEQVQQEKVVSKGQKVKLTQIASNHTKPDYTLMNGNIIKAYLDAKKTDVDIFKSKEAAFQVKSYGWSAGVPCSFLTNFEQFVIFDCRYMPSKTDPANVGAIQISIEDYVDKFDVLDNHLRRMLVYQNNLKRLYDVGSITGTFTVDELFNDLLSQFRITLAKNMYANNHTMIDEKELNQYVQIILDRIVFIRVCEAKGIEKEGLLLEYLSNGFWDSFKKSCYAEFYSHYDGAMFNKDKKGKFPKIILDDMIFKDFIQSLYYPYPYKFDAIPTKVIAKVYEEFLAYSLCIKNNKIEACLKEEYVKTKGAIPTPEFISEAICKLSFSELYMNHPSDIFDLRILDPCCGSGVFLVSAYEFLATKLMNLIDKTNEWCIVTNNGKYLTIYAKQRIMRECLYGIDCDLTAVEVTKMSLALKMIDDVKSLYFSEVGVFGNNILSGIDKNILYGNTLVDIDIHCNPNEIKYILPFNIKKEYAQEVFSKKGGFDFIIGNPPYVETKHFKAMSNTVHTYLRKKYKSFTGKADLSVLFIERALDLLNTKGTIGMIVQRRWFKTEYGKAARRYLTSKQHLHTILNIETNSLFKGRITYVSLMILKKQPCSEVNFDLIEGGYSEVQGYLEVNQEHSKINSSYFTEAAWTPELMNIDDIRKYCAEKFGTIKSNPTLSVRDGIQALWKKVYDIVDFSEKNGIVNGVNGFGEDVTIERGIVRPVIYNREFKPLKKLTPDAYRIFPYTGKDNTTPMSINDIKSKYPLAYNYLINNEKRIKEKVKCNAGEYWPTYTRVHNHTSFAKPKTIIPMTTKETYATFENNTGYYMDNANVWYIEYTDNDINIMKALTLIINSTVFSVFAKCGANQASNGYYKFNKQFLDPVPMPNKKLVSSNATVIKLAEMYDEIDQILTEYDTATQNEIPIYIGILEQKWKEVDDICYEFYELSATDVKAINEVGRSESRIPGGN